MAELSPEEFTGLTGDYSQVAPQGLLSTILYGNVLGESPADEALNRAGSVMGSSRANVRAAQARQGPLLSTLSEIINAANPVDWMGGIGGILAGGAPVTRKVGSKVFREIAEAAPAVREYAGKRFADVAAPHVAPFEEVLRDLILDGVPHARSTLRPAIRTNSGVISGDVAGGHGRLWESVSPAQQKGAIDGYIDRQGRFITRSQQSIVTGSMEGIRKALKDLLAGG